MSKVIFKMTFKHPNISDTMSKNTAHLNYIATRPGTDKTVTETDLKNELSKGIEKISSDDETYVKYINERPRSHGLFGQEGIENPIEVQDELSNVNSYVWRGIISLRETDAKELGYLNKETWQNMLRKKIPDMADEMGIPITNLRWVGAIHMEKGHPHAHVMVWEKEPKRTIGVINSKSLDTIRKMFTDEIFEEERFQLMNEKNVMRDLIKDLAKGDITQATRLIKEVRKTGEELKVYINDGHKENISPKLYNEEELYIANKIKNLADKLPGKGRSNLKFMPEEIKDDISGIADYMLQQPEFMASLEKNLNAVEELTRLYTSNDKAIESMHSQYSFIINRISNKLANNGVEKELILQSLEQWSNKFEDQIGLSYDDRVEILKDIKFDDNMESDKNIDEVFSSVSIKILDNYDIDTSNIKKQYVENELNERNNLFKSLVDNELLRCKDNTYSITDKGNTLLNYKQNLSDTESNLLELISKRDLTINDLLRNRRIVYKLNQKPKKFILKKYDAVVIKSYFGEENSFNLDKFKKTLDEKFKVEDKKNDEYKIVTNRIKKLIENGVVIKDEDKFSFTKDALDGLEKVNKGFQYTSYDANVVSGYVERADGRLTQKMLLEYLKDEYQNKDEVKKQYNYLIGRIGKNINSGYMKEDTVNDETYYSITEQGLEKRKEIMNPGYTDLKDLLQKLSEKDLINIVDNKYIISENYNFLKSNVLDNVKNNIYDLNKIKEDNEIFVKKLLEDIQNTNIEYDNIKKLLKFKEVTDPIQKARNNAYEDIKKRVSQIILKGAVESTKDNLFYIDEELSHKAVEFIKNMNNSINLIPEQTKVLYSISMALQKVGYTDEQTIKVLKGFIDKENISYTDFNLQDIINQVKNIEEKEIDSSAAIKKIEYYLSILKLSGETEKKSIDSIKKVIKKDTDKLEEKLNNLKENGILKKMYGNYKLTNKGVEEVLKVKDLDKVEKEIMKILEETKSNEGLSDEDVKNTISFNKLIDNKNIFCYLRDKDPEEFKLNKFDAIVRSVFGEDNTITMKKLESDIYSKYTDDELNVNIDKAEKEFESLSYRIKGLVLNGYVKFDKESGVYSFDDKINDYFEYDSDRNRFVYTEEAKEQLGINKMQYTRYDVNVTLSYIDKTENGILTTDILNDTLHKEIANKTAERYYQSFQELLDTNLIEETEKYISIDDKGNLSSTEEGKWLGINLNILNKYFRAAKGNLTNEKLKEICNTDEVYKNVIKRINKQITKGIIVKDQDTGVYKINSLIETINKLLYQIYKENGSFNKADMQQILEKNIKNYEAERQYKYLLKRLEFLKEEGYLKGQNGQFELTKKGIDKREDILVPERNVLRKELSYLQRLGLIKELDKGYKVTNKYYKYMEDIALSREKGIKRESEQISDVINLIDKTYDNINIDKIERNQFKILNGKYLNNTYDEIKVSYTDVREKCGIQDTTAKTVNNLATTLLVSGVGIEETKNILHKWNINNNNIDIDKFNEIVEKAHTTVAENNLWDKTTVISIKEWKQMFNDLGVSEEDIPKWIYKGENWESINHNMGFSFVNDLWKSVWRELERERIQTEAQAEYMKRQIIKQQSLQNKDAIKEYIRKNKQKGFYRDDELEI